MLRSAALGCNALYIMANEVISYLEVCGREGTSLQRGMNFGLGSDHSVVLMSVRPMRLTGTGSRTMELP